MSDEINQNFAIIHLGDQAYIDPVFNQCKKLLTNNNLIYMVSVIVILGDHMPIFYPIHLLITYGMITKFIIILNLVISMIL